MKIDILVAENLYHSTASFAKSLKDAFTALKVHVRILPADSDSFFLTYQILQEDPPDLTCSFTDIRVGNLPLSSFLHIPHLSFWIDPGIYSFHHLRGKYPLIASVDEGDVAFVRSFGFSNVFFLPHAADAKDREDPQNPREFEEVFFGTCIDIDRLVKTWPEKFSKRNVDILHAACARVLSIQDESILEALTHLGVKEAEMVFLHREVDGYIRGKDRIELLKNRKVHIWGEGPWEKYCPKTYVHPPVSYEESIELMKRSKVVFNSSPRFKQGSHERIFNALMTGACPVTLENSFVRKNFAQDELLTYRLGEYLVSTDKALEIAGKGQKKVLEKHTWLERAKTILAFVKQANFENSFYTQTI